MRVPVVHACSVLPVEEGHALLADGGYVRTVEKLGYNMTWVELLEMDGAPPPLASTCGAPSPLRPRPSRCCRRPSRCRTQSAAEWGGRATEKSIR